MRFLLLFICLFVTVPYTAETPAPVPPRGEHGFVTITTTPAKATVYLGGNELGKTPLENVKVESGRHDLTIMLQGEELVSERVNIWPNQTTTLDRKLVLPYGSLHLKTIPAKIKVNINGESVGETTSAPFIVNKLETGTHLLKLTGKGKTKEMEVQIQGEDTTYLEIKF